MTKRKCQCQTKCKDQETKCYLTDFNYAKHTRTKNKHSQMLSDFSR